jgi:hypothetical protein
MKYWMFSIAAALGLLAGCASLPLITERDLPEGAAMVAGGLSVQWIAPMDGTVIFLEGSSGKIIKSESLRKGEQFVFDPLEENNVDLLNRIFSTHADLSRAKSLLPLPKNALFLLYFVPAESDEPQASRLRAAL